MNRRLAIKWMLAAGAGAVIADRIGFSQDDETAPPTVKGYGTDPVLMPPHHAGEYWPLTFSDSERRTAAALCDVIVPAEGAVPSASALGIQDFIDEWISAPYPAFAKDRKPVTEGLAWVDAESKKRFGGAFYEASADQRLALCTEMAQPAAQKEAFKFFRRFRDLTTAGFFTTPDGMRDLGYVGNVPLARFDGPPADMIAKLGLTDEVAW